MVKANLNVFVNSVKTTFLFSFMKKRISLIITYLLSLTTFFYLPLCYALFNSTQLPTARPLSLGGAYVAIADDAGAINVNPAGLTQLTGSELALSYNNLYGVSDLSESQLLFGVPWNFNSFGFSYHRLALTDIYKEETFTTSYARMLRRNISLGLNLKLLRLSLGHFSANDVSAQDSVSEWSGDLALWSKPLESLSLGLTLLDFNTPQFRAVSNSSGERIYSTVRAGLAYRPKPFVIFSGELQTERGLFVHLGDNYHFGSELMVAKIIALRLGVDRNKLTGGIGFKYRWTSVDFAFFHQGELGLLYRVSAAFRWGQ